MAGNLKITRARSCFIASAVLAFGISAGDARASLIGIAAAGQASLSSTVCGKSRALAQADAKKYLAGKYPTSPRTQLMLLDSNMEAWDDLCRRRFSAEGVAILQNLSKRYNPSYSTIKMLYENNMEAAAELRRR